jgi:hypothetical protein
MKVIKGTANCCELCSKVAELRPYGPNKEWICFECGMKDEEAAKKQFGAILGSDDTVVVDATEIEPAKA